MTLVEFLLARIAEDEAGTPGVVLTRRDLADSESKRRIVKLCQQEDMPPTDAVLALLALPYAHHQDYRHEWLS